MTSQEYIINGLNSLVEKFPTITFGYTFEKNENLHIIKVEPLSEFKENKDYLIEESDFVFSFENSYMAETVMFVSNDSLIKLENPDLIFKANQLGLYIKEPNFNLNFHFNFLLDNINNELNSFALAA